MRCVKRDTFAPGKRLRRGDRVSVTSDDTIAAATAYAALVNADASSTVGAGADPNTATTGASGTSGGGDDDNGDVYDEYDYAGDDGEDAECGDDGGYGSLNDDGLVFDVIDIDAEDHTIAGADDTNMASATGGVYTRLRNRRKPEKKLWKVVT